MNTATQNDRITLYYRQGGSDKVYQAAIESKDGGFLVNFAFGRRGTTLSTGSKTPAPVNREAARKIYEKLVNEKMAKGYTPGADGTPYQQTDKQERSTGIRPQLLNPIDEQDVEALFTDDAWVMQEKFDGRRILLRKTGEEIIGINRSGLIVDLPQAIVTAAQELMVSSCLLDGEAIGDVYHVFDLLEEQGHDRRSSPYSSRLAEVVTLIDDVPEDAMLYAPTAIGTTEKRRMLARLKKDQKEGAVFKRSDAPYTPGRPASGGTQLKLKFTASASCIVAAIKGSKRSVALQLIDNANRVSVGNVTIPPNQPIPVAGTIVEVRYLYAYPGGSLYQPFFLGTRDDVPAEACTIGQLKFKSIDNEEV